MKNYIIPDNIDPWDAENIFYLKSDPSRLAKMLAHYEIYREIVDLPGAIVECGVYKGASLARFATFRDILETRYSRAIIGMDAFGEFPTGGVESRPDQAFIDRFESEGGPGISVGALGEALAKKGFDNIELIKGDIFDEVPRLLQAKPQLRIALLHLDLDVYEPTRFCIEQLLSHMTPGGLIVFDDYNAVEGATRAADELCRTHGLQLRKLPFYNVPSFVKIGA